MVNMSNASRSAPNNRKEIFAWALYDFANTSFSVIVVTVVFAVYFRDYIVGDTPVHLLGLHKNAGDVLWSMAGSLSMFLVAVTSPFLGAAADYSNRKKRFVFFYSVLCILSTALLYMPRHGMIWSAMALFVLANFGFEGSLVFYNAFLPKIATQETIGKVSGSGFAFGYVGALVSLMIALYYANQARVLGDITAMAPSFIWAALFFFVFSLPFYFWVHEPPLIIERKNINYARIGWLRTVETVKKLKHLPQLTRFLAAYFIYIDGVNTVMFFGALFATQTLGFSMVEVIIFFAITQLAAMGGAYFLGSLSDRIGPKPTVNITLLMWIGVTIGAFFSYDAVTFYIVGMIAGAAMGASQAASRVLMAHFIPSGMEAEFYGFYAMMGKFSAILGPLVFGFISGTTGSQRLAVLSISLFFITGYLLLRRVDTRVDYKSIKLSSV